jgi:hypothetical protein
MNLWMVKRDKWISQPRYNDEGGCHVQERLLLPLTQIQRHLSFPISPYHLWQVPLYFYASLKRITYACKCKLILQMSPSEYV